VLYLKEIFNGINDIQIFLRIWLSHDFEISNKTWTETLADMVTMAMMSTMPNVVSIDVGCT
jgi:hypothetical protein